MKGVRDGMRDNWGLATALLLTAAVLYPAAADSAQGALHEFCRAEPLPMGAEPKPAPQPALEADHEPTPESAPEPAPASESAPELAPDPAKLHANTLEAFHRYVSLTDARNADELKRGTNLLWIDELPAAERAEAYAALKRGEVPMKKLATRDASTNGHGGRKDGAPNDSAPKNGAGQEIACPAGIIHHWVGVVFIPGAKLDDVLGMLEDYDRHYIYFGPDVERSKIESRNGDHFRVFLRFRRHKVITVVLNTEHEIEYFRDGPHTSSSPSRAHSRSSAVRIAEVENAGKKDEREKPPGEDGGFLWGMETWWRFDERDGGVYVQSEVASLTRDIPVMLRWLIEPFVTSIPKETLTATLVATLKAVQGRMAKH